VEAGKARGEISEELDTDAMVAVIVNIYLGAITSKSLGLPQPSIEATTQLFRAASAGYRLA
jgi:hypothetical protein